MSTGEPAAPEPGQTTPTSGQTTPTDAGYAPPPGAGYPPPGGAYPPPGGYPPPGHAQPGHPQPGYAQSGYGQPDYAQPGGQPYAGPSQPYPTAYPTGQSGQAPLTPAEERTWAMAAHLSSVLGIWLAFLGALGPLVVLLAQGQRSPYVRAQAIEALNFNISVLIYSIVAWILVVVLIGFALLGVLFVFWLIFTVIATVKVSNGEPYRYPLTIRLVH
ncbi:MAG TPA: DUF4870 domain-containing protein [Pseudonocardia sp.]|jgi:hypothetical protein|nr:DUF4870 domain-containing protein [Pseudonocardia sp.]